MWEAKLVAVFLVISMSGCEEKSKDETTSEESEPLYSEKIAISGTLVNGVDQNNSGILEDQPVQIVRNDGAIVASSQSSSSGKYEIQIDPGALVIDSGFSLTDEVGTTASTADFSYQLESKVGNDGDGKALGVRQALDLGRTKIDNGKLDLGSTELKEISAIVGSVSYEDTAVTATNTDVFIPGKSFFVRTGDDGVFSLTFVPAGTYDIRIVKGFYITTKTVTVKPGKTTDLGELIVSRNERDPLPLEKALIGKWSSKCYYASSMATTPENPRTGTIQIDSLTSVTITGDSCFVRNFGATLKPFAKFIVGSDGSLITKFDDGSADYAVHTVINYTNDRITIEVENSGITASRVIEVLERITDD